MRSCAELVYLAVQNCRASCANYWGLLSQVPAQATVRGESTIFSTILSYVYPSIINTRGARQKQGLDGWFSAVSTGPIFTKEFKKKGYL